jgi:hypothetical protein
VGVEWLEEEIYGLYIDAATMRRNVRGKYEQINV